MTPDAYAATASERRIALLIDADNISHTKISAILAELSKHGTTNIRRAYGNWAGASLKGWTEKLHAFAIRPIQQFSYSSGKNATDIALVIDAMELLYTQKLDGFCLATSDADFTPLVMQLKASGHDVYGFGERKTPTPFVNACSTFLYLDSLDDPALRSAARSDADADDRSGGRRMPASAPQQEQSPVHDENLLTVLRGAVEATAREDGWAPLSSVGHAVRRQAPIDPRNYGARNFTALYEATGLFEIRKAENGHPYVADRSNGDRTPQP